MSDWEIDNSQTSESLNPSDWEMVSEPSAPQKSGENIGYSALMALPRIGHDIGLAAYHGIQKIPELYQSAKTEVPGLLNVFLKHPGHAAMQAAAGTQEAINNLAQLPLNLSQYGTQRLNLVPNAITNAIQKITREDTTQAINQLFGQPKYPGEKLLRSGLSNILNIGAATKLVNAIKQAAFLKTKGSIKNTILNTHDALENRASEGFKTVSSEVNNRGISQIPTNLIDPNMVDNLKEYFPKTKIVNSLLNAGSYGDYNALRKIQSDLYKNGKKNLGSSLESDRLKGAEMFEKREDINQAISKHLQNTGNYDLDNILNDARNDYKTLQKVYYNPNMNKTIVNMVNKDYRKIPNNLMAVLKEKSNPMQKLKDFHPGLESAVKRYGIRKNALSRLMKYGLPIGGGAAGGYAAAKYGIGSKE